MGVNCIRAKIIFSVMENNATNTTISSITALNSTGDALKSILLIILFFVTFLSAVTSFLIKRYALNQQRNQQSNVLIKNVFSLVSCFGAGVFLATCLLDLLSDSMDSIRRAEKRMGYELEFPLAAFCVAIGFLFVLFIEQCILYAKKNNWIGGNEIEQLLLPQDQDESIIAATTNYSQPENDIVDTRRTDEQFEPERQSTFRVLLLVFALSLHAIFEGLSIGMISTPTVLFQIFAALLIHKTVIGFSLGIRLVQSKLRTTAIVLSCSIFAGQVLVGGFLGVTIMSILKEKASTFLICGILQAIACGTFLYVTTFEILPHELNNSSNIPLKMLCLFLGFTLITIFIAIFPDTDSN